MLLATPESDSEEMRPIAVHVNQVVYDVSLRHTLKKRIAVVDLEFSKQMVDDLIENLGRIRAENKGGSIRVRFKGSMVLE